MSDNSTIEWTDATWNPTTGCDRVSDGCDNCYALTLAKRLKAMGSAKYQNDGDPSTSGPGFLATAHADALDAPLHWRAPRRVFVNSMSDLFHKNISHEFIVAVFATMAATPQHTYQILTKRHARMRAMLSSPSFQEDVFGMMASWYDEWADPRFDVPEDLQVPLSNVWLGVSVENQQWADIRIPALLDTPAAVRFLSCEPLLGPVDLHPATRPLDWVIVGGESGHGARPMHPDWARRLRDDCSAAGVPFHFKQHGEWAPLKQSVDYVTNDDRVQVVSTDGVLGGRPWPGHAIQDGWRDAEVMRRYGKHAAGRELDGRTWDEYPGAST